MPQPWKAPRRPEHKVTQDYNDGMLTVYRVTDTAQPGRLPVEELTKVVQLPYAQRKVGLYRYYQAAQNQTRVQRVLRVPKPAAEITNRDKVVTEDGREYRIDLVQTVPDVYPASLDLTLAAYRQGGGT